MPKYVSLLSGGIDSPVASYLMLEKKQELVLVHFHNQTIQKERVKSKVIRLSEKLSEYGKVKLYMIPFGGLQRKVIQHISAKNRMIVYRRVMFWIAEKILEKEEAIGFVTGDCLGQVASQTLDNLGVVHSAAKKPVLTPVLGFDKEEIVNIAKKIGTYELSIEQYSDCCSFMIAKHPETKAKLPDIEKEEEKMDITKEIKESAENAEIILP
ncbi:7-cyano-7-deazaguanine synthase [Candidatus Woesearchaeota archaeon]|nr:7-cyano-7-deazaguanine synthase [Candidatus Woesearchaeota archaeon]